MLRAIVLRGLVTPAFLLAHVAVSQPSFEVCNAVLSSGIRDNFQVLTESSQFNLLQGAVCSSSYDSYSSYRQGSTDIGVSVPLLDGLLGLSGSHENKSSNFSTKYSNFCSSNYQNYSNKALFSSNSSQVNASLINGWNQCMSTVGNSILEQQGVLVGVSPFEELDGFTARVRVRSTGSGAVKIEGISPVGRVRCSTSNGQPVDPGVTELSNFEFTLTCFKDPNESITFHIDTDRGISGAINIPSASSRILELTDMISSLQVESASMRRTIGEDRERLNRLTQLLNDAMSIEGKNISFGGNISTPYNTNDTCEWVGVGDQRTHFDQGAWCPTGTFLRSLDFDSCGSGGDCPIVGRALCCRL